VIIMKKRKSYRKRGYKSRRSYLLDRKKHAKYRPKKHYKKGLGHRGDWSRKKYRKGKLKSKKIIRQTTIFKFT